MRRGRARELYQTRAADLRLTFRLSISPTCGIHAGVRPGRRGHGAVSVPDG
jgi:hypothetical protein